MFDDFFEWARSLRSEGVPFATAIVVRAEPPTSAKPGDKAIVTLDGVMHGWIGGSCAQPTVVQEALRAIREDRSRLVRITAEPGSRGPMPGLVEVPMTCFSGGTLDVYIEPQQPQPRLLVVGSLPVARALGELGGALGYRIIAVDPEAREEGADWADELVTDLGELAGWVTPLTFVVVATHGQGDEEALERALATPAPYVALVASPRRAGAVRETLARRGVPAEQIRRLVAPAGLDIGARRGDEIALSILAQIIQVRRAGTAVTWLPAAESPVETATAAPDPTAVDPVCGMTVDPQNARAVVDHQGTRYFFCCPGCAERFRGEPVRYLPAAGAEPAG